MNADRAEASFWAAYLRNRNVDDGSAEDGAVAVAGGYALCALGTYTQLALAVGSTRPLTDDDASVLEGFYGRRELPVRLEVRQEVVDRDRALFDARGYELADIRFGMFESAAVPGELPGHVTVRPAGSRPGWVRLVTRAFAEGNEPDAESLKSAEMSAAAASRLFVAEVDGVPAGAGAVGIAGEVAVLYSGAVLPQFRGRGVHRALLRERVAFGALHGAARAAMKAVDGSPAAHSAQRAGFERTMTLRRLRRD
ncbi:MAG TPA: GNAT family N-acetyltransferase [Candidatus Elarobacter sp.]|jgi:GNAT superfamily N-acetyltransferase|nr:GNAT family N-acetyltransferase [Candidatus Elarobacter sp.]